MYTHDQILMVDLAGEICLYSIAQAALTSSYFRFQHQQTTHGSFVPPVKCDPFPIAIWALVLGGQEGPRYHNFYIIEKVCFSVWLSFLVASPNDLRSMVSWPPKSCVTTIKNALSIFT